jgi:hypothetical protein
MLFIPRYILLAIHLVIFACYSFNEIAVSGYTGDSSFIPSRLCSDVSSLGRCSRLINAIPKASYRTKLIRCKAILLGFDTSFASRCCTHSSSKPPRLIPVRIVQYGQCVRVVPHTDFANRGEAANAISPKCEFLFLFLFGSP